MRRLVRGQRTMLYIEEGETVDEFRQVLEAIASSEDSDEAAARDARLFANWVLHREDVRLEAS